MKWRDAPFGFRVYLFALIAALTTLVTSTATGEAFRRDSFTWLILTALLFLSEFVALSIHTRRGRYNLSAAEAVLMPMFVALSIPQVIVGALIANGFARPPRWRLTPVQELFNVMQYGCAAAVGAEVFNQMRDGTHTLSARNAVAALLATVSFAVASHILVAGGIALARQGRFKDLSLDVAPVFVANLGAELVFGLLLTGSYYAAEWMVGLFILPLAALFFGYRAVVSQTRERERVEHLHAASRVLASTPNLEDGVLGFLRSVTEIVSSDQAWAVIPLHGELLASGVGRSAGLASLVPVTPEIMRIFDHVRSIAGSLVIGEDEAGKHRAFATEMNARSLLSVPLWEGDEVVGCLLALDRVGPENFGEPDARILEAIGSELTVRLDAYRLFSEVAEERERFGRIFVGSKEGICLLDADGVVRAWNPALERITGHMSTDLMDKVWSEVIVIRDREENRLEGDQLIGAEPDEELELVTKSGPSRWVTSLSGPVGEAEGGGWVVLIRDVSGEHEIEAAKSDFLSTISHELRTPLTTIKGSLQVLARGRETLPLELADQMIGVTTRGAERLERLVMNLLAVSQIESGTMPVFPDELPFDDLVNERVTAMLKNHKRFALSLPAYKVVVRADRERMAHVIEHLLENALKFGGAEGDITITLDREGGYGHLAITDEGPGIPVRDNERIFERFVRLGDVLTRETQGAGVGLFIAKRSIEAMDGRIWVESEGGNGSTFHVTVPLAHPVAVEDRDSA